mmetsp:Transcript_38928/g.115804  ORF Transcript_38928/g.115804 Transcript_38928/m.115804 type:complete len:791 (+) Transcript_38928:789-3161(+)
MDTTEAAPAQLICHCSVQPPRLHSSHAVGVLVLDELGKRPDVFKCAHVAKADAHAAEGHVNPLESHLCRVPDVHQGSFHVARRDRRQRRVWLARRWPLHMHKLDAIIAALLDASKALHLLVADPQVGVASAGVALSACADMEAGTRGLRLECLVAKHFATWVEHLKVDDGALDLFEVGFSVLAKDLEHGRTVGMLEAGQLFIPKPDERACVSMHPAHAPQAADCVQAVPQRDNVQEADRAVFKLVARLALEHMEVVAGGRQRDGTPTPKRLAQQRHRIIADDERTETCRVAPHLVSRHVNEIGRACGEVDRRVGGPTGGVDERQPAVLRRGARLRALHPSLHGIDHARKVVLSGECKQRACQISTRIQRTATAAAITVSSSVSAAGVRRLHTRPQPHLHSVLGQRAERAVVRSRILTNAEHTVMVLAQVPEFAPRSPGESLPHHLERACRGARERNGVALGVGVEELKQLQANVVDALCGERRRRVGRVGVAEQMRGQVVHDRLEQRCRVKRRARIIEVMLVRPHTAADLGRVEAVDAAAIAVAVAKACQKFLLVTLILWAQFEAGRPCEASAAAGCTRRCRPPRHSRRRRRRRGRRCCCLALCVCDRLQVGPQLSRALFHLSNRLSLGLRVLLRLGLGDWDDESVGVQRVGHAGVAEHDRQVGAQVLDSADRDVDADRGLQGDACNSRTWQVDRHTRQRRDALGARKGLAILHTHLHKGKLLPHVAVSGNPGHLGVGLFTPVAPRGKPVNHNRLAAGGDQSSKLRLAGGLNPHVLAVLPPCQWRVRGSC